MMHPNTQLRFVNEDLGFGVFAATLIPKGTIVYARCALDLVFASDDPRLIDPRYADALEKYTYTEPGGQRVLCWDTGRYVNHCCSPSTLTTGYGFEIALRDLAPGDEITDDYAIFNCSVPMPLSCCEVGCRGILVPGDFDRHIPGWDEAVREALAHLNAVEQPLWSLLPPATRRAVRTYLRTGRGYRSVATQKAASCTAAEAVSTAALARQRAIAS